MGATNEDILNTMIQDIQLHKHDQKYEGLFIIAQTDSPYDFLVECDHFATAPKDTRTLTAHLTQEIVKTFGPPPPGEDAMDSPFKIYKVLKVPE